MRGFGRVTSLLRHPKLVEKSVPFQHRRVTKPSVFPWVRWLLYGLLTIGALRCLAYFSLEWDLLAETVISLIELVVLMSLISLVVNVPLGLITFAIKRKVFHTYVDRVVMSLTALGAVWIYIHEVSVFESQAYKRAQNFQFSVAPLLEKYHRNHGQYPESLDVMSGIPSHSGKLSYFREPDKESYAFMLRGLPTFFDGAYFYSSSRHSWDWLGD